MAPVSSSSYDVTIIRKQLISVKIAFENLVPRQEYRLQALQLSSGTTMRLQHCTASNEGIGLLSVYLGQTYGLDLTQKYALRLLNVEKNSIVWVRPTIETGLLYWLWQANPRNWFWADNAQYFVL